MANLFERPIAANPLSEFVGLPMELLQSAVQKRQSDYDQAKDTMEKQRDVLLGTTSSAADKARQTAILAGFETKIENVADEVGGDYSLVRPQLDTLTRQIKQELGSGELGSIHKNAGLMAAYRKELEDNYTGGKSQYSGYKMGLQSMNKFKTTLGENNTWSSFSGYTPSHVANVGEKLDEFAKNVQAKYMADGNKIVSVGDVSKAMYGYLQDTPAAIQALQENFQVNYTGDPKNATKEFKKYVADTVSKVASYNVYQEVSKKSDAQLEREYEDEQAAQMGTVSSDWQVPGLGGSLSYEEGGASWLKNAGAKMGLGTTEGHQKWVNSAEGKETIKLMEQSSGKKFPVSTKDNSRYLDQVNWLEEQSSKPLRATLEFGALTDREKKLYTTDNGMPLAINGAIYKKGSTTPISKEERAAMLGDGKTNRPYVVGILRGGVGHFTPGSVAYIGADHEEYIAETRDPRVLRSPEFGMHLLKTAKLSNTGKNTATLQAPIINKDSGKVLVPPGTYTTKKDPATGYVKVLQNGVEKYIVHDVYNPETKQYEDNITEI
jgi:hypothetical protein